MQEKIITCVQCNEPFVFSTEEKWRFEALGFDEPTRCPECRKNKNKGGKHDGPWKDKGRKKHARRKTRGDYANDM
jgi:uncharacterized protein with PIN domain